MKKVIFCQFSNLLLNPERDTLAERYFSLLYSTRRGYFRPDDFWEIPLWIARTSRSIPGGSLHIIRDVQQSIKYLQGEKPDYILCSVLEVNKHLVREIIEALPFQRFILGGYADPAFFNGDSGYPDRVVWFDSLPSAIAHMGFEIIPGESYRLFKGIQTIPRLTLSSGCLHHCAFCSVPKKIEETSPGGIIDQVRAMEDLDFELVYLNDKTFGQASNFHLLPSIAGMILDYNPLFQGFIIQTTAGQILRFTKFFLRQSWIKYIEIGVESFNDDILRAIKKPHNENTLARAFRFIHELGGIKIVPNIMIGLAGKRIDGLIWNETMTTYIRTLGFLLDNEKVISHINPYHLALYANTQSADDLSIGKVEDSNENRPSRSWIKDVVAAEWFYGAVLSFGIDVLNEKKQNNIEEV